MASELKVNKITPESGVTLTLGDSGDTINFGSGVLPDFENLTVTGDLTVDTNSLKVDSTNNFVGIGTATPAVALDVVGAITATGNITGTLATAAQPNITSLGTLTGLTTTGNINFGDNDKAVFGAGSDLQIYHDGSNSYVQDAAGTGDLILRGANVQIQDGLGDTQINVVNNGKVVLSYNANERLETTGTGIDVTGTVVSDGLLFNTQNKEIIFSAGNASVNKISVKDGDGAGFSSAEIVFRGVGANQSHDMEFWTGASPGSEDIFKRMDIDFNGNISFYEDTGTTPKLTWDASEERLGIGTTNPSSILEVQGDWVNTEGQIQTNNPSGTYSGLTFQHANNVHTYFYANSVNNTTFLGSTGSKALVFATNTSGTNNERMRIDSSGNVGIGTSSPVKPLHISASDCRIRLTDTDDATISVELQNFNGDGLFTTNGASNLKFLTDNSEAMRIDSSGRVGIGTTSPLGELQIGSSSSSGDTDLYVQSVQTSRPNLRLWSGTVAKLEFSVGSTADIGTTTNHPLKFNTNNSERMRIDSSGKVGIGTSSPAHFLHVSGEAASSTDLVLFQNTRTTGTPRGFQLQYSNLSPDDGLVAFVFEDSSAVRFRVNNDGDVLNHDGTYGTISDQRIKQNITDANSQWEDIKALSFKNFKKKDDVAQYGEENAPTELGLIAQELELTSPNLVKEYPCDEKTSNLHPDFNDWENSTIKGVKYSILYMKAVKALQEAMQKIEDLEARVNTLEGN